MRFHRLAALSLLALALAALPRALAQAPEGERRAVLAQDADYFGSDYRTLKDVALDECSGACLKDKACRAFTYNTRARWCFLKNDVGELKSVQGAVAGRLVAVRPEPPAATLGKPPALAFLPPSLAEEAGRFAHKVKSARPEAGKGLEALRQAASGAMAAGDARAAIEGYRGALALAPEDAPLWLELAQASLALVTNDADERYRLPEEATSAALAGYQLSRSPEVRARALVVLGQGLERRQLYRPAIEALKASLAVADSAAVRKAYAELRARHGFRILDHSVDTDAASPRICVQFSEELKRGRIDFAQFVTVNDGAPQAVSAEERQICIDGVKHGERYRIGLRAGIPSAVEEVLEQPAALTVYVRDRSPAVRFTGRKFVLPRSGPQGIPVVSVNTAEIEMELYRIGERGLARLLTDGKFLDQVDAGDLENLAEETGEKIWAGKLEVASVLNQDVTTSFPVGEALPSRNPGVYVLVARPKDDKADEWAARATQWFIVSDIGLSALTGSDGLHVVARSLASAEALAGVELRLVARNNEVLGQGRTGEDGYLRFEPGLARGKGGLQPAHVAASRAGADFAFLDLGGAAFDLSDRGVAGRPAPGPLDAFLYTERGVYRAGERVHAAALLRDPAGRAVEGVPLTFVFERPDGVEHLRLLARDAGLGGHAADLELPRSAMRGTWRVGVRADPKAEAIGEARFLVDDFVPDRLEFELDVAAATLAPRQPVEARIAGRYLYGAPAAGLRLEGEIDVRPAAGLAAFPGYRFGPAEEEELPQRQPLQELPATGADGQAGFAFTVNEVPSAGRPFEARLIVRMREAGGRAVERSLTLPIVSSAPMIGIRPLFADGRIGEGETARFEVIAVAPGGARTAMPNLRWELVKLERNFQWHRLDGRWSHEAVNFTRRIADGRLDATADAAQPIAARVAWGRYRLEVASEDPAGPATGIEFTAGWYVEAAATETPDSLDLAVDKPSYRPGEAVRLSIASRFAGKGLVTVLGERLTARIPIEVRSTGTMVELPVGPDWGAGAYVAVTAFRPAGTGPSHLPGRAVGIRWVKVDPAERTLSVSLVAPSAARPRATLAVPVRIAGLAAGEKAFLTVAAVDVGILNLTRYSPPDPEAWYFGQRRLGVEIRDLYGQIIDGAQGAAGRIRSGGDSGGLVIEGSPPTQAPVALFSGIVAADERGAAQVSFEVPEFNGTLRLMAVAWSRAGVGHAGADVVIRDPIVVSASLPRVLAPGDEARLRLDIDNAEGPAGAYELTIEASEELAVPAVQARQSIQLGAGQRTAVVVPLTGRRQGEGRITARLGQPGGLGVSQSLALQVRPAQPPLTERRLVSLAGNGGSLLIGPDLLADRLGRDAAVTATVTRLGGFDLPALLLALDRYPYGCAEQATSRALPLLYLSEVAAAGGLGADPAIRERVQKAIMDVLAKQSSTGSFGLWGPGSDDRWLDAYVTDFLTRAREQNYRVPDLAWTQALDNLQNALAGDAELQGGGLDTAYALYVLARSRRAALGDLRYYADTRLGEFGSALAKAQLGAALALYGEGTRASAAFAAALADLRQAGEEDLNRSDYGSRLRDSAATLALAAESRPAPAPIADLVRLVAEAQGARSATSTQENAWLLLAARALLAEGSSIDLEIDGQARKGNFVRRFGAEALKAQPVRLVNRGAEPVQVALGVTGVPEAPLPAGGNGFEIAREYYAMDGKALSVATVGQNERFVVVLKVRELNDWPSRVLIVDLLPAGFEIDNPNLVRSADLKAFPWLPQDVNPAHTEFRDDRFVAALDHTGESEREITLAYVVRAVTPGRYVHPPATVEDMYRPHLSARTAMGRVEVVGPRP